MRLLFDNNLSHKLCSLLQSAYPDSAHLARLGLGDSPDREVWNYAKQNDFTIVTKDEDFNYLSRLYGFPQSHMVKSRKLQHPNHRANSSR